MAFHLTHAKQYKARISLGFFEKMASNATIAGKLMEAGFEGVRVGGSGGERWALGTWMGPTEDVELPEEIEHVEEVE